MPLFQLLNPLYLPTIPFFAFTCPLASKNVLNVLVSWLERPLKTIIVCRYSSALLSILGSRTHSVCLLAFFTTRIDCLSPLTARPLHIISLQEFLHTPGMRGVAAGV
jgi:hypothetical protein